MAALSCRSTALWLLGYPKAAFADSEHAVKDAQLLDIKRIVSEATVRRAFAAIEEEAGATWLRGHLDHCAEPLLSEPWILDVDTTVKPLYCHQEGAVVGYNPRKPGQTPIRWRAHDRRLMWMSAHVVEHQRPALEVTLGQYD